MFIMPYLSLFLYIYLAKALHVHICKTYIYIYVHKRLWALDGKLGINHPKMPKSAIISDRKHTPFLFNADRQNESYVCWQYIIGISMRICDSGGFLGQSILANIVTVLLLEIFSI